MKIELVLQHDDRKLLEDVRRLFMAFADSVAKLQADVNTLISETGPAAVAAAVAAKDAQDAAAVDAVDASVVAAITPTPATPAVAPVAHS
jgi:predicted RNA methylase